MIAAELTTATVLISFGAVLGKTSPTQLLLLTLIETPLMVANEYIGRYILKVLLKDVFATKFYRNLNEVKFWISF